MMTNQKKSMKSIITLAALCIAGWYFFGGGLERQATIDMAKLENQVASDAEIQYGMTRRSGSLMDVCVQAGMVAAAYLQAKDESKYSQWKTTQATDCKAAGLPIQ